METVRLSSGCQMPVIGVGTWQVSSGDECKDAIRAALNAGYRHIDTAHFYQNEAVIGEVLQEYITSGQLKREEVFITTKLSVLYHEQDKVGVSLEESLKNLQLDYVDLFLVHLPCAMKLTDAGLEPDDVPLEVTWKGMEEVVKRGKAKSIGVSNFNKRQLERICCMATIQPVTNQVECHLYLQQAKLAEYMKSRGMVMTAYSPLGSPGRPADMKAEDEPYVLGNPTAKQLAEKHNKTTAQVLLRFLLQKGFSVIPKSTNPNRLKENLKVFDFTLSEEDMSELSAQDLNRRLVTGDIFKAHPEYPYNDEF